MTAYVPLYAGIADLPEDYKTDGRTTGFSRRSAWWAFNRVETIAAHRWGDMRKDVAAVRDPMQEQSLAAQQDIVARAAALIKEKGPAAARDSSRGKAASLAPGPPRRTGGWATCCGRSMMRSGEGRSSRQPSVVSHQLSAFRFSLSFLVPKLQLGNLT